MNLKTKTEPTPSIDWVSFFKQYKSHVYAVVALVIGSLFGVSADDIHEWYPTDPRVDTIVEQVDVLEQNDIILQKQIDEIVGEKKENPTATVTIE